MEGVLLHEGLNRLLTDNSRRNVASCRYTDETAFLRACLEELPDTIVLFDDGPLSADRAMELIGGLPGLSKVRLVVVLANLNQVEIYQKQHISAARSDDVVTLIQQLMNLFTVFTT